MQLFVRSSLPSLDPLPAIPPPGRRLTIVPKTQPAERNHLFVNNIRFWSMASIVAIHCIGAFEKFGPRKVHLLLLASFKFGTIGFFLVSGFLMGERVDRCKPLEYFMRRANKITPAWFIWFFLVVGLGVRSVLKRGEFAPTSFNQIAQMLGYVMWDNLWHSVFWFVPNLLLGIAILLVFRRYLYTLRLGLCLLAVNLVYVVNIYGLWFPSGHTAALFAFVVYLWLGNYIAHNFDKTHQLFERISLTGAVALVAATCVLSYGETLWIEYLGNRDPVNTLRLSNQLFSLSVALVLFKLKRPTWPRFVDVRRHTFGLYLSHIFAITGVCYCLKMVHWEIGTAFPISGSVYLAGVILLFSTTYLISLAITEVLARWSSLRWMVGLTSQRSVPPTGANLFRSQLELKS